MRILQFLLRPRTRWVICWLILLGSLVFVAVEAWKSFNEAERGDGNAGHTTIDFGGQWLMGRMLVEGQGRHLYDRHYLRPVAHNGYPAGVERAEATKSDAKDPKAAKSDAAKSDADSLMDWLAGTDDSEAPPVVASFLAPLAAQNGLEESAVLANAQRTWTEERLAHVTAPWIGGSLYPPVHALYYAPLSLLRPPIAYRVIQGFILVLVLFAGWVIQRMTEGRVWWPVASVFLMMFPGFSGCITLGQNGMFTLTVVLVGWWQLMRGREVLAGLCWGLLAFKPVWAAAFFLVPLLTARRRMAVSMALAGLLQIALT
ncbi:MAG: glycosyltransferase family 87 protein, partial [Gemmataceae bacterium]